MKYHNIFFDEYGDLKVTLNPAGRDTGIESSPLPRFPLHLNVIKNCVVTPESSMKVLPFSHGFE